MFASPEPTLLPLILIMTVGPIGAVDVLYFHIIKYRLYERTESQCETVIHLVRNVIFGIGALLLLTYRPQGLWYWLVGGLYFVDFINSLIDVSIEGKSRESHGGLTSLEYVIHTIGSTFAGAIMMAYLILGWEYRLLPTGLVLLAENAFPFQVQLNGYILVSASFILSLIEGVLLMTSLKGRRLTCA